jgi:hypothetical protein
MGLGGGRGGTSGRPARALLGHSRASRRRELLARPPASVAGKTDDGGPACLGEVVPLTTRLPGKGDERRQQLERGGSDPPNSPERLEAAKGTCGVAVRDDTMREGRADPRQALDLPLGRRIEVDRTRRRAGRGPGREQVAECRWRRRRGSHVDSWSWRGKSPRIELGASGANGGSYSATIGTLSRHATAFSRFGGPCRCSTDGRAVRRIGLAREGLLFGDGGRRAVEDSSADDAHGAAKQDHHGHEREGLLFGGRRHGRKMVPSRPESSSFRRVLHPMGAFERGSSSGRSNCGGTRITRIDADAAHRPCSAAELREPGSALRRRHSKTLGVAGCGFAPGVCSQPQQQGIARKRRKRQETADRPGRWPVSAHPGQLRNTKQNALGSTGRCPVAVLCPMCLIRSFLPLPSFPCTQLSLQFQQEVLGSTGRCSAPESFRPAVHPRESAAISVPLVVSSAIPQASCP